MEVEYLRDGQGNLMIAFTGFTYIKQTQYNQSKKHTKWNCVEKHKCCKGSLLTFCSKTKLPELVTEHNHPPHSRTGKDHMVSDEAKSKACTMSQPYKSSLMCNALQNKSGKKLQAASALKLQSFHSVPQYSCGAVCIEWITHHVNLKTLFPALLTDEHNVDVILASEGQSIKCHKLMLISSSVYFEKLLNETIVDYCFPVVAFTDWQFWQLKALVEYLYCGKVTVSDKKLLDFFSFVETLQIKGFQSWSNQTCLLSKNAHSGKQNFRRNWVIQNRLNSIINTIPEQTEVNPIPVECQKRKQDLIQSDDNIKAEGVSTKFAKFVLFCTRHSDDIV